MSGQAMDPMVVPIAIPAVAPVPPPFLPPSPARSRRRMLLDWSRQPGTQQGLSLLVAGLMLAWLHPFPAAEGIAATLLAASLPKLWPDNTTDAIRARCLSNALAHALATGRPADLEQAASTAATLLIGGTAS